MSTEMIRVLLVDPFLSFAESLAFRLRTEAYIETVDYVSTVQEALAIAKERRVNVAFSERSLPDGGAFQLAESIANQEIDLRVGLLAHSLPDAYLEQALRRQIAGFLLKTEPVSSIAHGMMSVARGGVVFSDSVRSRVEFNSEKKTYRVQSTTDLMSLSPRQMEVLTELAYGLTVKEVAKKMHLSPKSIDSHKYRIMAKLGIHDRVELARFAIREGIVEV